jgi:hypothetical protein
MTRPQPPPANQPKADAASSTLFKTGKCQELRKLLYDISLPKTSQATTCIFQLKNLLKARTLIDAIIDSDNTQLITPLETLCNKIEELTTQVDELKKVHSQTKIPQSTKEATGMTTRRSYADVTTTGASTPAPTSIRSKSLDKSPTETRQNPTRRPPSTTHTRQSKHIIM